MCTLRAQSTGKTCIYPTSLCECVSQLTRSSTRVKGSLARTAKANLRSTFQGPDVLNTRMNSRSRQNSLAESPPSPPHPLAHGVKFVFARQKPQRHCHMNIQEPPSLGGRAVFQSGMRIVHNCLKNMRVCARRPPASSSRSKVRSIRVAETDSARVLIIGCVVRLILMQRGVYLSP